MTQMVEVFADGELAEMFADEPGLLAICDAIARARPMASRRRSRKTMLLVAVAAVLALAAPAVAVTRAVIDFLSSPPAPAIAVVAFGDMSTGAPRGMDPRAFSSEARTIQRGKLADGTPATLSVAPTAEGGFCYLVSFAASAVGGSCDAKRELAFAPGFVAPRFPGPAILSGSVLDASAATAEIRTADGRIMKLPLVRISAPIEASFYFGEVDISRDSFPLTTTIVDRDGQVIASKTFSPPPPP